MRKLGFQGEDAEELLNELQQFRESVEQDWSQVENQWRNLQSVWRSSHYEQFAPQIEYLSRTYGDVDQDCETLIAFLQNLINISERRQTEGLTTAAALGAGGNVPSQVGGAGGVSSQARRGWSYQDLIEQGRRVLGDRLVNVDERVTDFDAADGHLIELMGRDIDLVDSEFLDDALEQALNDVLMSGAATVREMEKVRNSLIAEGLSEVEAKELADKVAINVQGNNGQKLGEDVKDFFQFTKGAGSRSLKELIPERSRAWAHPTNGKIGIVLHDQNRTETLWHEMGHHAEFEKPELRDALASWVRSRSTSPRPKYLKDLTRNPHYGNETAYPDHFIDPYVGKVYGDNSTEVMSMGMQYFKDAESMLNLYRKDKEHFYLIVGAIRGSTKV
jgi:hypothetical protein